MQKRFKNIAKLTVASLGLGVLLGAGSVAKVEASEEKELLVYSNSLSSGRGEFLKEKALEQGFKLTFVEGGAGEIYNRLLAEKGSPQADVVIGMDEAQHTHLKNEGMYVEYEPVWIDDIKEEANVGDGYFYPWSEERIVMIYNQEYLPEDEAPTNWQDLGDKEEFHGKYSVADNLGGSTNQKVALSILLQYVDEEGELGISDEGWEKLEDYYANGVIASEGVDPVANLADGSVPIYYRWSSGVGAIEEEYGFTASFVNPPQGVITMREQVAVIDKGDDKDYSVAKEFLDWFGSAEFQEEWAKEFNTLPANTKTHEVLSEGMKRVIDETTPWEMDWEFIGENLDDWIEKIELDIMY